MARVLIEDSTHSIYNKTFTVRGGVPVRDKITERRMQDFQERHDIVYCRLKGCKQVSPDKQLQIEVSIAEHLGRLKRHFDDKIIDPDQV
ncbi:hypothetical protein JG688_00013933 [Phytophthora aleatoria]|uniref:Uncharacterized protein n=1 Tax=Phytophthora aleatoria TaxID=2496075 RepID=A0A8J5J143_9STRA|nr:hypothetical protein JG688_00013933 [Phytophthora aleatoria]